MKKSHISRPLHISFLLWCCHLVYVVLILSYMVSSNAGMATPTTLDSLTTSAARIFRGHCVAAEIRTEKVANAFIPVTIYTFRVSEYLKDSGPATTTFRQVGTPKGGIRDLGRLVGLPIYVPDTEYVLFLLPESGVGLTSPAGAGQGAFMVSGEQVQGMARGISLPGRMPDSPPVSGGIETMTYEALRNAVREQVKREK